MMVSAPPKPPDVDPLDALIEEARRRARRRRQRYAGATALVLGALLAAYVGVARGGGSGAKATDSPARSSAGQVGQPTSMSFRLLSILTSYRQVGGTVYVKSQLRNGSAQFGRPRNGVVGSDSWMLRKLATPGWVFATAVVKLPGGTLRLRGRMHASSLSRSVAVVGGTGRFAHARGTVFLQERTSLPSLNDYRLRLD